MSLIYCIRIIYDFRRYNVLSLGRVELFCGFFWRVCQDKITLLVFHRSNLLIQQYSSHNLTHMDYLQLQHQAGDPILITFIMAWLISSMSTFELKSTNYWRIFKSRVLSGIYGAFSDENIFSKNWCFCSNIVIWPKKVFGVKITTKANFYHWKNCWVEYGKIISDFLQVFLEIGRKFIFRWRFMQLEKFGKIFFENKILWIDFNDGHATHSWLKAAFSL